MKLTRKLALLIVPVLAALGLGFSTTAAFAADNANVTPLYNNSFSCHGAPASSQVKANQEGFVNFHLDGQTVTLNYHIKNGVPDTDYYVFGYDSFCHFDAALGKVTTNSNGVANADFSYTIPAGTTEVWTFAEHSPFFSLSDFIETPAVTP